MFGKIFSSKKSQNTAEHAINPAALDELTHDEQIQVALLFFGIAQQIKLAEINEALERGKFDPKLDHVDLFAACI
jgi:hypothetical protein